MAQAHLDEACTQLTDSLFCPRETSGSQWKEARVHGTRLSYFFCLMRDNPAMKYTQAFSGNRHRPWSLLCCFPHNNSTSLCILFLPVSHCHQNVTLQYHQDRIRRKSCFTNDRHCYFHSLHLGIGLRSLGADVQGQREHWLLTTPLLNRLGRDRTLREPLGHLHARLSKTRRPQSAGSGSCSHAKSLKALWMSPGSSRLRLHFSVLLG